MKEIVGGICGIVLFGLVIWGTYWVAKTVSYQLFYETMVDETIKSVVMPEYLIKEK